MADNMMSGITQADPGTLASVATKMAGPLGTLEGNLQQLAGIQGDLNSHVQGQTGKAVYNALGNAYETGRHVASFMQTIMDTIQDSGINFDNLDLDGAARIGADGGLDVGTTSGSWNNNSAEGVQSADLNQNTSNFGNLNPDPKFNLNF
ncbi:hypothetical protein [Nocardia sp. NPDC003345]